MTTDFTILHLSDLHRNEDGLVANDQLISSLLLDADRYTSPSQENLNRPTVIIISGDLIFGSANSDQEQAKGEVKNQYREAEEFLNLLTNEFLNGDKNRMIIVPGNHDVQWSMSKASMEKIDQNTTPESEFSKIKKELRNTKTNIRWNWDDLSFYKIIHDDVYNSRMELFSRFYESFYEGRRSYSLDPDKQYDIFDIPSHNIAIATYNSCFRNDHLNRSGLINSHCLSESVLKLRDLKTKRRLLFAVWHHNFSGLPNDDTYLDPRQVKSLNAYGYSIGFHGHQHMSDIVESYIQFDNSRKLVSVSAGTLCSAGSHLPTGYKRQYNLLRINYNDKKCCVYSREMHGDMFDIPMWDKGRINESVTSSADLNISFPEFIPAYQATDRQIDSLTILLKEKKYENFLDAAKSMPTDDPLIRSLLIELDSQTSGNFKTEVCELLINPEQNKFDECILFLDDYLERGENVKMNNVLSRSLELFKDQKNLVDQLKKYQIRIDGYK